MTVSIRARMTIAVLRVRDDVIVMQTMLWPDEIRAAKFANLGEDVDVKPAELAMAHMLVDSLAGDYRPDDYEDDYQAAVESLVRTKLEGGEVQAAPAAKETGGEVVDLLAALQRSVERAKASRGEPTAEVFDDSDDEDTAEADLAPDEAAKKAENRAVAKTTAKKTATRKTAAKKRAAS